MIRRLLLALAVAALAGAAPAAASEQHPSLVELENEVICPTCHTLLALSSSAIAERMRVFISARIAAGDTKSEIKAKLVDEFGEGVLAAPPKKGFNLLVWVLPIAGALLAVVVVGLLARRWVRTRPAAADDPSGDGSAPLDPELERRLDEELARFEA